MTGFIIIILILLVLGLFIFVMTKINNFFYRTRQHVFNKVGIGSSNINAGINNIEENLALPNILAAHPNYTKESLKNIFNQFANDVISKTNNNAMSSQVLEKFINDKSLEAFKTMTNSRTIIVGYRKDKDFLMVSAVYSDGKDEHNLLLNFYFQNGSLFLDKYDCVGGKVF